MTAWEGDHTNLVGCVGAKNVERRSDKFGLDRDSFSADCFSGCKGTLDGIDPSLLEASEFDICSQLDRLRGQSSGDSGHQGVEDRLRDVQAVEDVRRTVHSDEYTYPDATKNLGTHVKASLNAS